MPKFIELTEPHGKRTLVNIRHIIAIDEERMVTDPHWNDGRQKLRPAHILLITGREFPVTNSYDEICSLLPES